MARRCFICLITIGFGTLYSFHTVINFPKKNKINKTSNFPIPHKFSISIKYDNFIYATSIFLLLFFSFDSFEIDIAAQIPTLHLINEIFDKVNMLIYRLGRLCTVCDLSFICNKYFMPQKIVYVLKMCAVTFEYLMNNL